MSEETLEKTKDPQSFRTNRSISSRQTVCDSSNMNNTKRSKILLKVMNRYMNNNQICKVLLTLCWSIYAEKRMSLRKICF